MDNILKRGGRRMLRTLTLNIDNEYKSKYEKLSVERKIRVSEHLRRVIYPEIDRLWQIEFDKQDPPDNAA